MENEVHIALCCDARYLPYAATTMASCIRSCAEPNRLHFHLVAIEISDVELKKLRGFIEREGSKITFHSPDNKSYSSFHTERYGPAVYHRISLPDYLQGHAEWVIYLDSDILVVDDIEKLWKEKERYPEMITGAVLDYSPATESHVDVPRAEYFNSGVLLINVKRWLECKISEKTISYLKCNHDRLIFVDQCSLNAIHKGRWQRLALRWNIQGNVYSFWKNEKRSPAVTRGDVEAAISSPGIIHFIASKKPWKIRCYHPYEFKYRSILKETPFHEGALPSLAEEFLKGWLTKPLRRFGQLLKVIYVFLIEVKK